MNWTTLCSTLLGGLLALGGGLLGQWWNERHATEREKRNREHEREVWARELRHEAHMRFLNTFDERYQRVAYSKDFPGEPEPPEDWLVPVWSKLQELRMVSHDSTIGKAKEAIEKLHSYTYDTGKWQEVDLAVDRYLGAIREEFHLSPITLMDD